MQVVQVVRAGIVYFLIVFAVGWILGPIRVLWVIPHLGATVGVLLEAPLMLVAMILASRWAIRRWHVPARSAQRWAMGLIALGCLFAAELAGAVWLRRMTLQEYLAAFTNAPGLIALAMFLLFAAMPMLVRRKQ